jgi:hypothetical protein
MPGWQDRDKPRGSNEHLPPSAADGLHDDG